MDQNRSLPENVEATHTASFTRHSMFMNWQKPCLQGRHDDLTAEHEKLQQNLRDLTEDQRKKDDQRAIETAQVKQEAENSVARLRGDLLVISCFHNVPRKKWVASSVC